MPAPHVLQCPRKPRMPAPHVLQVTRHACGCPRPRFTVPADARGCPRMPAPHVLKCTRHARRCPRPRLTVPADAHGCLRPTFYGAHGCSRTPSGRRGPAGRAHERRLGSLLTCPSRATPPAPSPSPGRGGGTPRTNQNARKFGFRCPRERSQLAYAQPASALVGPGPPLESCAIPRSLSFCQEALPRGEMSVKAVRGQ